VKIGHAIDFLCEDMKVKVTLKFRGREMAHTEFGFQVIEKFLTEIAAYGHPDFEAKLNGRAINVMISPLPRNKRAKHPSQLEGGSPAPSAPARADSNHQPVASPPARASKSDIPKPTGGFSNSPFAELEVKR